MERTIGVLTQNNTGVLSRLSGLMERRGFQVKGMGVGTTQKADRSRFTFVIGGDSRKASQAVRQIRKMLDTVEIEDLSDRKHVERCLMLMKFTFPKDAKKRAEMKNALLEVMRTFSYSVLEDDGCLLILETLGTRASVSDCLEAARPFGLEEAVKSGPLALGA